MDLDWVKGWAQGRWETTASCRCGKCPPPLYANRSLFLVNQLPTRALLNVPVSQWSRGASGRVTFLSPEKKSGNSAIFLGVAVKDSCSKNYYIKR